MLDTITAITIAEHPTVPNWRETLTVGDIVAFRFPVSEEDSDAQPKSRPCLVLDLETLGETCYAVLAYGTTAKTGPNRGYEINVRARASFVPAGLHKPTRFIGARRLLVPLTSADFVCAAATGAPTLGRLSGEALERLHAVRARIHAERDIAADRRAERRARYRRRSCAARPFSVEARHPKRRQPITRSLSK